MSNQKSGEAQETLRTCKKDMSKSRMFVNNFTENFDTADARTHDQEGIYEVR